MLQYQSVGVLVVVIVICWTNGGVDHRDGEEFTVVDCSLSSVIVEACLSPPNFGCFDDRGVESLSLFCSQRPANMK